MQVGEAGVVMVGHRCVEQATDADLAAGQGRGVAQDDVVVVAGDAVGSERHDGVGPDLVDDRGDGGDQGAERRTDVLTVGQAQASGVSDPDRGQRRGQLTGAQARSLSQAATVVVGEAAFVQGGRDAGDVAAGVGDTAHEPGREVGLVVGVGPDAEEPSRLVVMVKAVEEAGVPVLV